MTEPIYTNNKFLIRSMYPINPFIQFPSVPRQGLAIEWLFNGNAIDTSGNGKNGTVTNASLTTGKNGNSNSAYLFSGTGKIQNSAISSLDTYSVSLWYKKTVIDQAMALIGINNSANKLRGCVFSVLNQINIYYGDGKYKSNANTIAAIYDGNWHHIVAGFDGTSAFLYFDGISQALGTEQNTGQVPNLSNSITVGALATTNSVPYTGTIDAVRVYSLALTQANVVQLYNSGNL